MTTERDRLTTFFYLLTGGTETTDGLGWRTVIDVIDDAVASHDAGPAIHTHQGAEMLARDLMERLLGPEAKVAPMLPLYSTREAMRDAGLDGWEMGSGMSAADAIRELMRQRDQALAGSPDLRRRETLRAAAEMLSRVREWASEPLIADINAMIDRCNLDAIADGGVVRSEPMAGLDMTIGTRCGVSNNPMRAIAFALGYEFGETPTWAEMLARAQEAWAVDWTSNDGERVAVYWSRALASDAADEVRGVLRPATASEAADLVAAGRERAPFLQIGRVPIKSARADATDVAPVYRWVPGMRARNDEDGDSGHVVSVRHVAAGEDTALPRGGTWIVVAESSGMEWRASAYTPDLDHGPTRGALLDQVRELSGDPDAFVSKFPHTDYGVWPWNGGTAYGTGPTEGAAIMDALTRLASKPAPSDGMTTEDRSMDGHATAIADRGPWVVQWSRFNEVMAVGYWDESAAAEQCRKIARDGLSSTVRPATLEEDAAMRRSSRGCGLHHLQPGAKS